MLDEAAVKLAAILTQIKDRRKTLEQEWLNSLAAWKNKRVRSQYSSPDSRFQYRVPAMRRVIERSVVRSTQMLLPNPQFFEIYPGHEFDVANSQAANAVRAYMLFLLTRKIQTRRLLTQITRSLLLYSRAIVKTGVKIETTKGVKRVWPTVRPVDPFSFYVWPETASETDVVQMIFEHHMMPWQVYEAEQARLPQAIKKIPQSELVKPVWEYHIQERLANTGLTDPTDVSVAQPETPEKFLSLSEVWLRSQGQWFTLWLLWNHIDGPMLIRQHPSLYAEPPYRYALARPLIGEHYTNGQGQDIESLDVWFNDLINQMEEARTIAALPPVSVDPDEAPRTENMQYGPRQIWKVRPEFVKMLDIPDTSGASLRVAQLVLGLINSIGGSGTVAEGQPSRNMPRAGYAVNQLVSLGMADIKDVAEILEQEILTPMLQDIYDLTLDFVPHDQVINIPGSEAFPDPRSITTTGLLGSWDFRWVGSLQQQDAQMRSQKLMSFAQLLVQAAPILQQAGYTVNWPDFIKSIWRDGLGERGLDQIIRSLTDQEKQAMMAQQMQAQGGGQSQQGFLNGQVRSIPQTQEDLVRQLSRQFASQAGG